MDTIKSCTNVEQSKKLAEILPVDSADMAWCHNFIKGVNYTDEYSANLYTVKEMKEFFDKALNGWDKYFELIPCWSLAALFNYLREIDFFPKIDADEFGVSMNISYYDVVDGCRLSLIDSINVKADGFIDACYEIIVKLNNQKLL